MFFGLSDGSERDTQQGTWYKKEESKSPGWCRTCSEPPEWEKTRLRFGPNLILLRAISVVHPNRSNSGNNLWGKPLPVTHGCSKPLKDN